MLLFHAGRKQGPLCPACLADGPRRASQKLLQRVAGSACPQSLAALIPRLAAMDRWSISLADLMAQEKAHLRSLYPKLTEDALRARVEEHYGPYLEGPGRP